MPGEKGGIGLPGLPVCLYFFDVFTLKKLSGELYYKLQYHLMVHMIVLVLNNWSIID